MSPTSEFTDIGLTVGWLWMVGIGLGIIGLGVILGGVTWIAERDRGFAAAIGGWVAAISVFFLGPWFIFYLIAEPHNLHNYQITGRVETVSNAGLAEGEDFTYRAYVIELDSTDEYLVTSDPRAVELVREMVTLTCTPQFVFRGADRWDCVIAEVAR